MTRNHGTAAILAAAGIRQDIAAKREALAVKLKRRKVEDGDYEIVDEYGAVVARVQEWGVRGYRWRVLPVDPAIRQWDSETISGAIAGLTRSLAIIRQGR